MSFARDRRLSGSSLGGLGVLECRPVGCGGPPVRLLGPVFSAPPLSDVPIPLPSYSPSSIRGLALTAAVADLREKGAIDAAPPPSPGYYSRLFVTPKVTGGWRPVIDLSRLNRSVRVSHFHMETQQSVLQSLRQGDWMASLDLLDAYLQVTVHPESRRFLRFCVGEEVWQFCALCFGLSTAPQAFTRVMAPISSIMHRHGFPILRYLDDWLVLGSSFQNLVWARYFLLWLCQELGVQVNLAKSSLTQTQSLDYLGMRLQTLPLTVFPTPKRVLKLNSARRVHLLSAAASASVASPSGGDVFSGFHRARAPSLDARSPTPVKFRRSSVDGFGQHSLGFFLPRGSSEVVRRRPSSRRPSSGFLSARAVPVHRCFGFGLGGLSRRRPPFRLVVSPLLCLFHQPSGAPCGTHGVQGFLPLLRLRSVSLFADNTTALAYLRNQGGTHSSLLNSVAQVILRICESHQVHLVPQFIPGRLNVLADSLSRRS